MLELAPLLTEIIPELYEAQRQRHHMPYGVDLSRSNLCHELTLDLYQALSARGLPVRREFHYQARTRLWHFVVAHSSERSQPSSQETITDLCPWQFHAERPGRGYLHAPRPALQERLRRAGTPAQALALYDLDTIIIPHTTEPWPSRYLPAA